MGDTNPKGIKHLIGKLRVHISSLSRDQRIGLVVAFVVVFILGIIGFIWTPNFSIDLGPVEIEAYTRPVPVPFWLLESGLCVVVLVLVLWWRHRKSN